jgi:hypothetical protein
MAEAHTPVSISGQLTTASTALEEVPLVENGAAPALFLPVPDGDQLVISDVGVCATANSLWLLEQSNDNGVTFYEIGIFAVPGVLTTPTRLYSVRTGWVINGTSTGTRIRMRVSSAPSTTVTVVCTIRGYRAP